jgi:tRNA threonylcarbamoyladenosine biosynthesis protein TsaB
VNVLSIDTATEVCGIGLLAANGNWLESIRKAGLKHAEVVMDTVHRILADAELSLSGIDLIVCSSGPGSFTGLRIGMATAKGLAAGGDIPLVSVPTLDAIAFHLQWSRLAVVPVLDARKKRIYTAAYRNGEKIRDHVDLDLHKAGEFLADLKPLLLTGPGVDLVTADYPPSEDLFVDTLNLGWNRAYVELGIERYNKFGPEKPDAGPEYLRKSDAELNLGNG